MSLFGSSSKTSGTAGTSPINPPAVEGGLIDLAKLINSLGNKNPQQYVTGASPLQNAAFSMGSNIAGRYGAQVTQQPAAAPQSTQPVGSPTLFSGAGITPQGSADYAGYVTSSPNLLKAFKGLSEKDRAYISKRYGDGSGSVTPEMYGKFHYETYGQGEGRDLPNTAVAPSGQGGNPSGQAVAPVSGVSAVPDYGYETATGGGINPVEQFATASRMAKRAGNAGPNLGEVAALGATPRGIDYAGDYENKYTDDVVNTTLAGFDENAGRLRASEAAAAAGNNAFGGSRFGVQRAITEEGLARERAATEAGLRYDSADRAFGLGMQDAGMDLTKMLTEFGAANDMSRFNAGQEDTALARKLAASAQMGDLASAAGVNERADLSMLAGLGEQERGIAQDQSTADLKLIELMTQLYGMAPLQLLQGQRQTGTSSTKNSPSMIDNIGSVLDLGSRVAGIFG